MDLPEFENLEALRQHFVDGQVLLIDKPLKWTSFDAVKRIRGALSKIVGVKRFKVGHAGTLDPLATGLLILCTGKFTKRIDTLQAQEKTYTGTFTLGATTPSYDLESEIDKAFPYDHITPEMMEEVVKSMTGVIQQIPPAFSAIQIDGKRAYESARKGKKVEIAAREVTIHAFELTRIALPEVDFKIVCSKGTYIRTMAHDFGKKLNSGAHLSSLRRTAIGEFQVDNAANINEITDQLYGMWRSFTEEAPQ